MLHLNWLRRLPGPVMPVVVINPLMARRLCPLENSIRENKTDPIDARSSVRLGPRYGEKLLAHYRFRL